jgi:uncharacterized Zn finger protein (UPF0148 family)
VCATRTDEGAIFCAACGAFLKDENGRRPQKREAKTAVTNGRPSVATDVVEHSMVQLLGEITHLQRDLLRQFRQGQALQARQFEKALQAQALQLEKTLAHTSQRVEASEERLQVWQKWTAGLAAAVLVLLIVAFQLI